MDAELCWGIIMARDGNMGRELGRGGIDRIRPYI